MKQRQSLLGELLNSKDNSDESNIQESTGVGFIQGLPLSLQETHRPPGWVLKLFPSKGCIGGFYGEVVWTGLR